MAKFRGLFIGAQDAASVPRQAFDQYGGELITLASQDEGEIIEALKDVDVALGRLKPTSRMFESMDRCQGVAMGGHGFDGVDLASATSNGIILANAASFGTEEVSNHTLMLLLVCARKFVVHDKLVKRGKWTREHLSPMGHISGQTLGLIGTGNIGRAVGRKARALGLSVVAYDPYAPSWDLKEYSFEPVASINEVCEQADFLSLHTPLTEESYHSIGEEQITLMKPTAYLINASRGKVVDEEALIRALESGEIAGAGLDVFEQEPVDPNNPLLKMDNVAVTNHYASYSEVAFERAASQMGEEAVRIALGHWPMSLINPDVRAVLPPRKGARAWGAF